MKLKIGSYNCNNYFDSNGLTPKPSKETTAIAKSIQQLDLDILCLQEVENIHVLNEINQSLDSPFEYCHVEPGNSRRGIHLGVMSRLPFESLSHRDVILKDECGQTISEFLTAQDAENEITTPLKFQRDCWLMEFSINEYYLVIANTHLKSRKSYPWHLNETDVLRVAETRMIRKILTRYIRQPNTLLMLVGDLNQRRDHESIVELTQWEELRDPVFEEIASKKPTTTTFHSKKRERIDYLLLSHALYNFYVSNSAYIHRSTAAKLASDHFPVSIEVDITK